ncbi:unnamed protein product [Rotaria socialis]
MPLATLNRLQLTPDINICRTLIGMWQVSGSGYGRIDPVAAVKAMFDYLDAGFTTWDLADIYGPAEDLMGEFRRQLLATRGETALSSLQIFTKWVPQPTKMTKKLVEESINKSLTRIGVKSIDLLQFHWWDYHNNRRPEVHMIQHCQKHNIKLLTYGTLCGGLLSEKYLGKPEPRVEDINTPSLKKYKNMIDSWGGWELFQELLIVLKQIANKYGVSIGNVAVRYILDKPTVGGVIIGARLGLSEHLNDNVKILQFSLDNEDVEKIDTISRKSRDLYRVIGDCGDEYR